ncbi:MAG TPA: 30S ribosomal protein S15 [Lentisphaeria bacterium]|nr:MAG: 30S ribosomal protein S15 [Lentisphaerae bacterium GWF2_38_69]HBM16543.1 30S ribosomal protein S15 [Lentisphaeria bacterium]
MKSDAKKQTVDKFALSKNDTGSAPVQVASLSTEIKSLTEHLKEHKKDHSSRRGLIAKVNKRRKLLNYFKREKPEECEKLIQDLKIRHQ